VTRAHTLIVGAGISGLMVAYELARRGAGPIRVVDSAPGLLLGASGRNGGGVRAQWTTVENITMARESIATFARLAAETGTNTWFRQGGYLFLARTSQQAEALEKARRFQNAHGVRTRLLTPAEAKELVPALSTKGVEAAAFNPDDGTLFPWPVVHGVAESAKRLGVEISLSTPVDEVVVRGDDVVGVRSGAKVLEAENVVVAVGARTRDLMRPLGVDLPTKPQRHEILVTEALKPFLDPMVVDLSNGLYASQAMRGEVVGGLGRPHPDGHSQASSLEFSTQFARALLRLIPRLGGVNVLRQWAGTYDLTPDARPILGRVGRWKNLLLACGFSGHGFMLAPMTGRLLSEIILDGRPHLSLEKFSLERFESGELELESMVIG
jgi:sarcosine oxidase, subunit beta